MNDSPFHADIMNLIHIVKLAQRNESIVDCTKLPCPDMWMNACHMVNGMPADTDKHTIEIHLPVEFIQLCLNSPKT